jgi:hypothetical protein
MKLLAVVLGAATAIVAATALAAPPKKVELEAKMSGKQEVPGPGDHKGKGEAQLLVNTKKQKVCFLFEYDIPSGTANAGHIHKGAKGEEGKIVVELFTSEQASPVEDCVKVEKERLLKRIAKTPGNYYVNLHNQQFPDGAIRGQLKLAPGGP